MIAVPIASCHECGLQSAGRCPTCRHALCLDHFRLHEHEPCATRVREHATECRCYVCGAAALPEQWSSEVFAHYIDRHQCAGCHRPICDRAHTACTDEEIVLRHDGLRSHRYHYTRRYCAVCAPLRRAGGILGVSQIVAVLGGGVAALALIFIQFFHH